MSVEEIEVSSCGTQDLSSVWFLHIQGLSAILVYLVSLLSGSPEALVGV